MKFLGKFKPYVLPLALGVLGALVYDRWVKMRLPAMLRGGSALLMLTLALAFSAPDLRAEVVTKGGAINLRPINRETAHFAYTNGVANPGLPGLFRVTNWQGTNHLIVTTNGVLAVVKLGTNYVGYTGHINGTTATALWFQNGLLCVSNSVQQPNP